MLEDTEERGGRVRPLKRGRSNFCPRGEDLRAGGLVLPAGTLLRPVDVANLLACGLKSAEASRRPKIGILCTGSELVDDPALLRPGQIVNTNGPLLSALAAQCGLAEAGQWAAADEPGVLARAMNAALDAADLVVISGGVSVGEFDLVPEMMTRAGLTVHFSGVAIKPGMPVTFATGGRRIAFGLPGNPVAVYLTFHLFVLRGVGALTGGRYPVRSFRLPLARAFRRKRAERLEFIPARLTVDGRVQDIEYHGSGHLAALSGADGLFGVPPGTLELSVGEPVEFLCMGMRSDEVGEVVPSPETGGSLMPDKRILVIDDDPDVVAFCRQVLESRGYVVAGAASGAEGLAAARAHRPDLVILDIMMEEADSGLKVAEALGAGTPILMLSSIAQASDQVFDMSRLPISDLVEKPIAANLLVEKVMRLLGKTH